MSAHGHQMEREYSARSLSGGEGSDMGSQFEMESVIYMSSFAATIFIGGLVTVGVLLMTLLVALTVMLQSCQSRSNGTVEMWKSIYHHEYEYCQIHALHAELNGFESYSLPEICKDVAVKYIKVGDYKRDLNTTISLVENYFNNVMPVAGGLDVVLMDIDDFLPSDSFYSNPLLCRFNHPDCHDCVEEAKHLRHIFLLQIYMKLQAGGWPLIFLSRKPEKLRDSALEILMAAGFGGWTKLIMRSDEEMKIDTRDYFSRQMVVLQAEGYHIRAVISSYMDALVGPFVGMGIFKLPNLPYYSKQHYTESATPAL